MIGDWPFTDPTDGQSMILRITGASYGDAGVRHPGCDQLADIAPEVDAFYCHKCGHNGRISGAWFLALWTADENHR